MRQLMSLKKGKKMKIERKDLFHNCENCEAKISVTLSPYGNSFMAVLNCPNCGESYDTDISREDIESLGVN